MELQKKEAAKKTYNTPELSVYGDIRAITQGNDMAGQTDNPMGANDKT
jgi:hypothetical protein